MNSFNSTSFDKLYSVKSDIRTNLVNDLMHQKSNYFIKCNEKVCEKISKCFIF